MSVERYRSSGFLAVPCTLFRRSPACLFILMTLLLAFPLVGQAAVDGCPVGAEPLYGNVLLLEDRGGELTAAEVLALPDSRFYDTRNGIPYWGYTRSVIWLRFELANSQFLSCARWLTVGAPRLEDVQVAILRHDVWFHLQGGSDYPLELWNVAARQPRFKLNLQPGERVHVVVRVASRSAMLLYPTLWDDSTLMAEMATEQLVDGFTLGIVLLLVLVGAAIGTVMRSRLLVLSALVLLGYSTFTLVVNGYLFYWSALLPWSREVLVVLAAISYLLAYFFIYTLLGMSRLGRWFNIAVFGYVLVVVLILLQGAVGDVFWSLERFRELRYVAYILVPLALLCAIHRRVHVSWLAWLFCGLFSLQGASWLWKQLSDDVRTESGDVYSLQSSLIFVLLLICTLTFESLKLRRRERLALEEVEHLQQAENERLESQVEQRTAQLRETLNARSSLLGRISHDLRSPLNSIINYARESRASSNNDYLERIERHARQQLTLLDDLVAFSKSQLQQIELSLTPGYLFGFLQEIEEEGQFLAQRRNNVLRCELADDLPAVVNADFQLLRRVLINLLNNAAKFTRDGVIVLQIKTLSREEQGSLVRFAVRDTGVGFSVSESHGMVEAFQRGNNALGVDGFGLGLSIVDELLKQMGAELRIESAPGRGSAFSFELGLCFASEEELDNVFLESHTAEMDGDDVRIVLVDDIALTRAFLGDLLLGYGFDVTTVATAEEALLCLAEGPADLLITDQLMPGKDGWALLHESRLRYPDLPVLLYSSMPPTPPAGARQLAFDSALLKPASTDQLLDRVRSLCRRPANESDE